MVTNRRRLCARRTRQSRFTYLAFTLSEFVAVAQRPVAIGRLAPGGVTGTRPAPGIPVITERAFVAFRAVVAGPAETRPGFVVAMSVERSERITTAFLKCGHTNVTQRIAATRRISDTYLTPSVGLPTERIG